MKQEKILLRKNEENCCCIEKMSYAQLFDLPLGSEELLYTCAAFFLFHELYHVNSFAIYEFDKKRGYEEANKNLSVCNVDLDSIKT